MEDLEGQEAAPTTESKISLVRKYRLILHVFRGRECQAQVQMWEMVGSNARASDNINPYLLQYENASLIENHLFSLRMIVDGVAEYFPYATHEKLGFLGQLPNWGFKRVDTYGKSSSNETTEHPAKEKHSGFTPGPWNWTDVHDLASDEANGKFVLYGNENSMIEATEADRALISAAPDLYNACKNAHRYFTATELGGTLVGELAAALTKAGKK